MVTGRESLHYGKVHVLWSRVREESLVRAVRPFRVAPRRSTRLCPSCRTSAMNRRRVPRSPTQRWSRDMRTFQAVWLTQKLESTRRAPSIAYPPNV